MHFGTKSYLKSNRNHTVKQTLIQWGYAFEDQNHVINVLSTSS
jgi:hypothetical protein